ncbi:MAG: hypothetical protein RSC31_08930 [Anaerovoracaceae bacterium]
MLVNLAGFSVFIGNLKLMLNYNQNISSGTFGIDDTGETYGTRHFRILARLFM